VRPRSPRTEEWAQPETPLRVCTCSECTCNMYANAACTPTVTMYVPYLNTAAVFRDSFAGRYFCSPILRQPAINKMLLALAHQLQAEEDDEQPLPFHNHLIKRFRMRRICQITRRALMDPFSLPFLKLYHSQCTQSFITYTGFDYKLFESLLLLFTPYFEQFTPYSDSGRIVRVRRGKGCKRMISPIICLRLVLAWTWTRGNLFSLQLDFRLLHSCLCFWLCFGMRIIINVLQDHPLAHVRKLSREEVAAYQKATVAKYPSHSEVWGTLDGLNLNIQSTKDDKIQSIFYNGWTHGHYVSSVFVFGMDGVIKICGLNAPGTMHDSTLADL
jgi:hypothetical protein